jgi:hypothetical protein
VDLGLSDDEAWGLTPRLILQLLERHRARERRVDLRFGAVAAEIRNTLRSKKTDRVWTAEDIFPDPDRRPPTREELRVKMQRLRGALGQGSGKGS